MLFANDRKGHRVNAEYATKGQVYYCPICDVDLVLKQGEYRIDHFAHKKGSMCSDSWSSDMSEWHLGWQRRFPDDCQEVVRESEDGERHRADVLIENSHIVIEFQHSHLSQYEFRARSLFYKKLGYNVIWLFDVSDNYDADSLCVRVSKQSGKRFLVWERGMSTFEESGNLPDIEVYFQLKNGDESRIVKANGPLSTWLIEIEKKEYSSDDFLNQFSNMTPVVLSKACLYDELFPVETTGYPKMFHGCPKSPIHLCAFNGSSDKYPKGCADCGECKNAIIKTASVRCHLRFKDLVGDGYVLRSFRRRPNGSMESVTLENDGILQIVGFDDYPPMNQLYDVRSAGATIGSVLDFWDAKNPPSSIVLQNISSGKYCKITRDPFYTRDKYGKVYGFISDDLTRFPNDSMEVYYAFKKVWTFVARLD